MVKTLSHYVVDTEKITDRSNGLEKDKETIFLDIVCCFKGYELTEVQNIPCALHSYNVKDQMEVPIDESLAIQDLIEKMAKELVHIYVLMENMVRLLFAYMRF